MCYRKLYIENLSLRAIMGIQKQERTKKQKIVVNIKILYKYKNNILDYSKIVELVKKMITKNRYFFIENALIDIKKKIKQKYPQVKKMKLKISKLNIIKNATVGVGTLYENL